MKEKTGLIFIFIGLMALVAINLVEGQLLDQLMNQGNQNINSQQREPSATGIRSMFKDMMSVNIPVFYDMVKNGTSMGINVLSGLVKVERGEEATRSGLEGPRPMSVRVFGIPVFERGRRVRGPDQFSPQPPQESNPSKPSPPGPEMETTASDDEDLPIIP